MLKSCPSCGSELGPYVDDNGSTTKASKYRVKRVVQVICTTCGMRGPFASKNKSAEEHWNDLPRKEKKQ